MGFSLLEPFRDRDLSLKEIFRGRDLLQKLFRDDKVATVTFIRAFISFSVLIIALFEGQGERINDVWLLISIQVAVTSGEKLCSN